jgi:hypothetical protein
MFYNTLAVKQESVVALCDEGWKLLVLVINVGGWQYSRLRLMERDGYVCISATG